MCLSKKIIAALLCSLAVVIGSIGISANTANAVESTAATTATNTAATGTTVSIETLQQIVLMLQQQIQQIIKLIAELKPQETCGNGICRFGETAATCAADCSTVTTCAKEGATFQDVNKKCCDGLEKVKLPSTCGSSDSQTGCAAVISYTCQKKAINQTCSDLCTAKGYTASRCNAWATGTLETDPNTGCKASEVNQGWTSDCTASQLAGGGRACCCSKTATVCTPKAVSGCNVCNSEGTKWVPKNSKCSTGQTCRDGKCIIADYGKTKCTATGGTWTYSDCASGCIFATKTERTSSEGAGCATVCVQDYKCTCPSGKYWASREEGCITSTTACAGEGKTIYASWSGQTPTTCCSGLTAISSCTSTGECPNNGSSICAYCGNGKCGIGENKYNCPKDCGTVSCVQKGITFSDNRECCAGLTKIQAPGCAPTNDGTEICKLQYSCVETTTTCAKEGEWFSYDNNRKCCDGLTATDSSAPCPEGANYCSGEIGYICRKPITTCAKEGEYFYTTDRKCCDGLSKVTTGGQDCGSGTACAAVLMYTCKRPTTTCAKENQACSDTSSSGQPISCCDGYQCSYPGDTTGSVSIIPGGTSVLYTPPTRIGICVKKTSTCATEGQYFWPGTQKCCDGLTELQETPACSGSTSCITATMSICKKPDTLSCSSACHAKGYLNSYCSAWSTGTLYPIASTAGCNAGYENVGWTSDCTAAGMGGGGRACCCAPETPPSPPISEMCGKTLSATPTTAEKEACAKAGGNIFCSAGNQYCTPTTSTTGTNYGYYCPTIETKCTCACGGTVYSSGGSVSSINTKTLSASLAQAIDLAKNILNNLLQK